MKRAGFIVRVHRNGRHPSWGRHTIHGTQFRPGHRDLGLVWIPLGGTLEETRAGGGVTIVTTEGRAVLDLPDGWSVACASPDRDGLRVCLVRLPPVAPTPRKARPTRATGRRTTKFALGRGR